MDQNQAKPDRFAGDFNDFGSYLRFLRRRAALGQRDLGLAVGYGEAQISRLEHNHRLPDLSIIRARFIPALELEDQPELADRLIELARLAHEESDAQEILADEIGVLEAVPLLKSGEVLRPGVMERIEEEFSSRPAVMVYGFPGIGKSTVCAAIVRKKFESNQPVFWHTVDRADPAPLETFLRQAALFLVSLGQADAALLIQPGGLPLEVGISSLAEYLILNRPFMCVDEFHHLYAHMTSPAPLEELIHNSGCQFLLASRERLDLAGVAPLPMEGMTGEETRALLEKTNLSLFAQSFKTLHALTRGNPMLLKLAASELDRHPTQIDQFLEQVGAQREIASYLLENALHELQESELNLLSLVSIFRQPVNLLDVDLAERLRGAGLTTDLNAAISLLQRRQFLEDPSNARLHPMLQDHLELFLNARPDLYRTLHLLAANHLRTSIPASIEPLYHFVQSGAVEDAIEHTQGALLHWDSTGQGEAAADLVASLLKRTRNTPALSARSESVLLSQRGQLLMSGRRAAEAEADFRQALSLALQSDVPAEDRASIMLRLARFLLQRGKIPEVEQLCDEAESQIASGSIPSLLAETLAVRCTVCLIQSRLEDAARLANEALQKVEPLMHREVQVAAGVRTMCYNTLGILSHIRRDIPAALTNWRKAEEAALLAGNLRTAFRITGNIAGLHFDQGELNEARQTYEGIQDAVQAIGDVFTLGKILNALGAIYHLQARPAEALEILDRARHLKRLVGDVQGEATTENQRAQVLLARGGTEEALPIVERLLKQTEETGEMRWRASYLDTLGMTYLALGEFSRARERLEEAMSLPGAASDPQLKTYLRNHLALASLGMGELAAARKIFSNSDGMLDTGIVGMETRLVEVLVMAGDGLKAAQQKTLLVEREASRRALSLYANAARRVREGLQKRKSISECVSLALGAGGLQED